MHTSTSLRWLVVAVSAAMLLVVAAACSSETIEVPGETVVVEKVVTETVEVPGETVVVEKEVIKTVEVPGETVVKEVVKTVEVPGETVVVEKEVVKEVEVPGETVVVEKVVVKEVEGDRYTRNVWGELVEKPQYGGTIPVAMPTTGEQFDTWYAGATPDAWAPLVLDNKMGDIDWALPRDEYDTTSGYYDPNFITGELAESWDISPDGLTYTFHIRKGVHWHDKPPMNGREVTAYDTEFSWQRALGLGEFAEAGPSPYMWGFTDQPTESVTAIDKYTLVVKLHTPSLAALAQLTATSYPSGYTLPPEVIKQYGDMKDWRHVVGTGPYEISGFVPGSSLTFTKNPNYWQDDPRYPDLELRLPYADEIRVLVIPDMAARVAALRTGQSVMGGGRYLALDQVKSLRRSNPELVVVKLVGTSGTDATFGAAGPPFDDKNVRIAMQKAINLEEINTIYYEGDADPEPVGFAPRVAKGLYAPYAEWPEEVKEMYRYDPVEAERLLDEAGYKRGADGIRFKVGWDIYPPWGSDIDLAQIVTGYFDKIGVDVTLMEQPDGTVMFNRLKAGEHGGMTACGCRHKNYNPMVSLPGRFYGEPATNSQITDHELNAIVDAARAATNPEEYNRLAREMDAHFIKKMYSLMLPVAPQYMLHQPWLKDYRGELGGSGEAWVSILAYTWVDQELKEEMGH